MKEKVLVLCTGNSCRSQMGEGILRQYGDDKFEVFSAGSRPSEVNPTAIQVMKEIGIDISGHRSKHLKEYITQGIGHIITVCDDAKDACPFFPGDVKRHHIPFPDPPHNREVTDEVINEFRKVRDMIHVRFKRIAQTGFDRG